MKLSRSPLRGKLGAVECRPSPEFREARFWIASGLPTNRQRDLHILEFVSVMAIFRQLSLRHQILAVWEETGLFQQPQAITLIVQTLSRRCIEGEKRLLPVP